MRAAISTLDTTLLDWVPWTESGHFIKPLNGDPLTGEGIALHRLDPAAGYRTPSQPVRRDFDVEILLLAGRARLDGESWAGVHSWAFFPAGQPQHFREDIEAEVTFIERVMVPRDGAVLRVIDPASAAWHEVVDADGRIVLRRLPLDQHAEGGAGAMVVDFAPGWASPHGPHFHTVYEESFILSGALDLDGSPHYLAGCYSYKPPLTPVSSLSSAHGARAFVHYGGRMDFRPAAELDAAAEQSPTQ